jgi:hypothetical protein
MEREEEIRATDDRESTMTGLLDGGGFRARVGGDARFDPFG